MNFRRHLVVAAVADVLRAQPQATRRILGWSAVGLLPALVQGWAIAHAIDDGFLAGSRTTGLLWLAVPILTMALGAIASSHALRHAGQIADSMRDGLVERVVCAAVRESVSTTGPIRAQGVVARITQQIEFVRGSLAIILLTVFSLVFSMFAALLGIATLSGTAFVLVVPPVLLALGLYAGSVPALLRRFRPLVRIGEEVSVVVQETAGGLRDLQLAGATGWAAADCGSHVEAQRRATEQLAALTGSRTLLLTLGGRAPAAVLLLAGPWLLRRGMSPGELAGAITYATTAIAPTVRMLGNTISGELLGLWVILERLLQSSPAAPPEEDTAGAAAPNQGVGPGAVEVCARGLSFAYGPHAEPVVHDLDLTVHPGEHLAVIGASGIGKSTLVNLICGMLAPTAGEVRVHGAELSTMSPSARARRRVLIPQEAYVFTATLGENLRYLRPEAQDTMLDAAAAAVGMAALAGRLGGYAAVVNPALLSAADRQLIALARAWLSPAPLIVLDEGTCHLDPAVEAHVERSFAARPGTLIVVAHRISSARRADRILLLDGTVALSGGDAELLRESALYRDLVGHWDGAHVGVEAALHH